MVPITFFKRDNQGYNIATSARFNGVSSFLVFTPRNGGINYKQTQSVWLKFSRLQTHNGILLSSWQDTNPKVLHWLWQVVDGKLYVYYASGLTTYAPMLISRDRIFVDLSNWYHITATLNTNEVNPEDRLKIYVNGSLITDWHTDTRSSTIPRYTDRVPFAIPNIKNYIGSYKDEGGSLFEGYMADYHFVDGEALGPESFTKYNTAGKKRFLVPKIYEKNHGLNGFHLKFDYFFNATKDAVGIDSKLDPEPTVYEDARNFIDGTNIVDPEGDFFGKTILSSATSKFGNTSLFIPNYTGMKIKGNGTLASSCMTIPISGVFESGNVRFNMQNDWTIEAWVYPTIAPPSTGKGDGTLASSSENGKLMSTLLCFHESTGEELSKKLIKNTNLSGTQWGVYVGLVEPGLIPDYSAQTWYDGTTKSTTGFLFNYNTTGKIPLIRNTIATRAGEGLNVLGLFHGYYPDYGNRPIDVGISPVNNFLPPSRGSLDIFTSPVLTFQIPQRGNTDINVSPASIFRPSRTGNSTGSYSNFINQSPGIFCSGVTLGWGLTGTLPNLAQNGWLVSGFPIVSNDNTNPPNKDVILGAHSSGKYWQFAIGYRNPNNNTNPLTGFTITNISGLGMITNVSVQDSFRGPRNWALLYSSGDKDFPPFQDPIESKNIVASYYENVTNRNSLINLSQRWNTNINNSGLIDPSFTLGYNQTGFFRIIGFGGDLSVTDKSPTGFAIMLSGTENQNINNTNNNLSTGGWGPVGIYRSSPNTGINASFSHIVPGSTISITSSGLSLGWGLTGTRPNLYSMEKFFGFAEKKDNITGGWFVSGFSRGKTNPDFEDIVGAHSSGKYWQFGIGFRNPNTTNNPLTGFKITGISGLGVTVNLPVGDSHNTMGFGNVFNTGPRCWALLYSSGDGNFPPFTTPAYPGGPNFNIISIYNAPTSVRDFTINLSAQWNEAINQSGFSLGYDQTGFFRIVGVGNPLMESPTGFAIMRSGNSIQAATNNNTNAITVNGWGIAGIYQSQPYGSTGINANFNRLGIESSGLSLGWGLTGTRPNLAQNGWLVSGFPQGKASPDVEDILGAHSSGKYWQFGIGFNDPDIFRNPLTGFRITGISGLQVITNTPAIGGPRYWGLLYSSGNKDFPPFQDPIEAKHIVASYLEPTNTINLAINLSDVWHQSINASGFLLRNGQTGYFRIVGVGGSVMKSPTGFAIMASGTAAPSNNKTISISGWGIAGKFRSAEGHTIRYAPSIETKYFYDNADANQYFRSLSPETYPNDNVTPKYPTGNFMLSGKVLTQQQWNHIAITHRSFNPVNSLFRQYDYYLNGEHIGRDSNYSATKFFQSSPDKTTGYANYLTIGAMPVWTSGKLDYVNPFYGFIDEIKINTGIYYNTGNFRLPATKLYTDYNTILYAPFDGSNNGLRTIYYCSGVEKSNLTVSGFNSGDLVSDSPSYKTFLGINRVNYAILNKSDLGAFIGNGGLTLEQINDNSMFCKSTFGVNTGKWYWEAASLRGNIPVECGIISDYGNISASQTIFGGQLFAFRLNLDVYPPTLEYSQTADTFSSYWIQVPIKINKSRENYYYYPYLRTNAKNSLAEINFGQKPFRLWESIYDRENIYGHSGYFNTTGYWKTLNSIHLKNLAINPTEHIQIREFNSQDIQSSVNSTFIDFGTGDNPSLFMMVKGTGFTEKNSPTLNYDVYYDPIIIPNRDLIGSGNNIYLKLNSNAPAGDLGVPADLSYMGKRWFNLDTFNSRFVETASLTGIKDISDFGFSTAINNSGTTTVIGAPDISDSILSRSFAGAQVPILDNKCSLGKVVIFTGLAGQIEKNNLQLTAPRLFVTGNYPFYYNFIFNSINDYYWPNRETRSGMWVGYGSELTEGYYQTGYTGLRNDGILTGATSSNAFGYSVSVDANESTIVVGAPKTSYIKQIGYPNFFSSSIWKPTGFGKDYKFAKLSSNREYVLLSEAYGYLLNNSIPLNQEFTGNLMGSNFISDNNPSNRSNWSTIYISADGKYQYAIAAGKNYLYKSEDYGKTWINSLQYGFDFIGINSGGNIIYRFRNLDLPVYINQKVVKDGALEVRNIADVFYSKDGGNTFDIVENGLPTNIIGTNLQKVIISKSGNAGIALFKNNFYLGSSFFQAQDPRVGNRETEKLDQSWGAAFATFVSGQFNGAYPSWNQIDLNNYNSFYIDPSKANIRKFNILTSAAMSETGKIKIVINNDGSVFRSVDNSSFLPQFKLNTGLVDIAMSNDGSIVTIISQSGQIFNSNSFGANGTYTTIGTVTGNKPYKNIKMSYDGTYQLISTHGNYLYTSNDAGATWNPKITDTTRVWNDIDISSDGLIQIAISSGRQDNLTNPFSQGEIFISTNYGLNWKNIKTNVDIVYSKVAQNKNGQYKTVVASNGGIYTSSNFGLTWKTLYLYYNFTSVDMSHLGDYQIACTYNGLVYKSIDYGNTWTQLITAPNKRWKDIAISKINVAENQRRITLISENDQIYITSNGGAKNTDWIAKENRRNWKAVALSDDGKYQTALGHNIKIYRSEDFGASWSDKGLAKEWSSISINENGLYQMATEANGQVYDSSDYGNTWTVNGNIGGAPWSSSSMNRNGSFRVVSSTGIKDQWGSTEGVWFSKDTGNSWTQIKSSPESQMYIDRGWKDTSISADGRYIIGLDTSGYVYNSKLNIETGFVDTMINAGIVYLYTGSKLNYKLAGFFTGENIKHGQEHFGHKVKINQDGDTIAISAPYEKTSLYDTERKGAVYVYTGRYENWKLHQKITSYEDNISAPQIYKGDLFGWDIDLNVPSVTTGERIMIIGEPGYSLYPGGVNYDLIGTEEHRQGRVSIYRWDKDTEAYQFKNPIYNPIIYNSGAFGYSVASNASGNIFVIGAPSGDSDPKNIYTIVTGIYRIGSNQSFYNQNDSLPGDPFFTGSPIASISEKPIIIYNSQESYFTYVGSNSDLIYPKQIKSINQSVQNFYRSPAFNFKVSPRSFFITASTTGLNKEYNANNLISGIAVSGLSLGPGLNTNHLLFYGPRGSQKPDYSKQYGGWFVSGFTKGNVGFGIKYRPDLDQANSQGKYWQFGVGFNNPGGSSSNIITGFTIKGISGLAIQTNVSWFIGNQVVPNIVGYDISNKPIYGDPPYTIEQVYDHRSQRNCGPKYWGLLYSTGNKDFPPFQTPVNPGWANYHIVSDYMVNESPNGYSPNYVINLSERWNTEVANSGFTLGYGQTGYFRIVGINDGGYGLDQDTGFAIMLSGTNTPSDNTTISNSGWGILGEYQSRKELSNYVSGLTIKSGDLLKITPDWRGIGNHISSKWGVFGDRPQGNSNPPMYWPSHQINLGTGMENIIRNLNSGQFYSIPIIVKNNEPQAISGFKVTGIDGLKFKTTYILQDKQTDSFGESPRFCSLLYSGQFTDTTGYRYLGSILLPSAGGTKFPFYLQGQEGSSNITYDYGQIIDVSSIFSRYIQKTNIFIPATGITNTNYTTGTFFITFNNVTTNSIQENNYGGIHFMSGTININGIVNSRLNTENYMSYRMNAPFFVRTNNGDFFPDPNSFSGTTYYKNLNLIDKRQILLNSKIVQTNFAGRNVFVSTTGWSGNNELNQIHRIKKGDFIPIEFPSGSVKYTNYNNGNYLSSNSFIITGVNGDYDIGFNCFGDKDFLQSGYCRLYVPNSNIDGTGRAWICFSPADQNNSIVITGLTGEYSFERRSNPNIYNDINIGFGSIRRPYNSLFGASVAISDSGNVVMVGAPKEFISTDPSNTGKKYGNLPNAGATYLYTGALLGFTPTSKWFQTSGTYRPISRITASNRASYNQYGSSISINKEGDFAVVGSNNQNNFSGIIDNQIARLGKGDENILNYSGAAYIYNIGRPKIKDFFNPPIGNTPFSAYNFGSNDNKLRGPFVDTRGKMQILTYMGNATDSISTQNIEHKLDAKPAFVLTKCISNKSDWWVWHQEMNKNYSTISLNDNLPVNNSGAYLLKNLIEWGANNQERYTLPNISGIYETTSSSRITGLLTPRSPLLAFKVPSKGNTNFYTSPVLVFRIPRDAKDINLDTEYSAGLSGIGISFSGLSLGWGLTGGRPNIYSIEKPLGLADLAANITGGWFVSGFGPGGEIDPGGGVFGIPNRADINGANESGKYWQFGIGFKNPNTINNPLTGFRITGISGLGVVTNLAYHNFGPRYWALLYSSGNVDFPPFQTPVNPGWANYHIVADYLHSSTAINQTINLSNRWHEAINQSGFTLGYDQTGFFRIVGVGDRTLLSPTGYAIMLSGKSAQAATNSNGILSTSGWGMAGHYLTIENTGFNSYFTNTGIFVSGLSLGWGLTGTLPNMAQNGWRVSGFSVGINGSINDIHVAHSQGKYWQFAVGYRDSSMPTNPLTGIIISGISGLGIQTNLSPQSFGPRNWALLYSSGNGDYPPFQNPVNPGWANYHIVANYVETANAIDQTINLSSQWHEAINRSGFGLGYDQTGFFRIVGVGTGPNQGMTSPTGFATMLAGTVDPNGSNGANKNNNVFSSSGWGFAGKYLMQPYQTPIITTSGADISANINVNFDRYIVGGWNGITGSTNIYNNFTNKEMIVQGTGNIYDASYLSILFSEVEGFSKFGTYIGNAIIYNDFIDGPFITTNFTPKIVLIKDITTWPGSSANPANLNATHWTWIDNFYNRTVSNNTLYYLLNKQNQVIISDGANNVDFYSNGFKIKSVFGTTAPASINCTINTIGAKYIYAAFSETPFQYSNAYTGVVR